ncbi:hypothetical protein C8R44DRAFT_958561 [Mycena epipterygia]|nr:hypothetical protein C8R44DRAFT_958561 [Mycena epipterygia]
MGRIWTQAPVSALALPLQQLYFSPQTRSLVTSRIATNFMPFHSHTGRVYMIDPRTGRAFSASEEDSFFTNMYGSVERGRQMYRQALDKVESGKTVIVGRKPVPNEPITVIPFNTDLSVRIRGKGMEQLGNFCFDFVDNDGIQVKNPLGIRIFAPESMQMGVVSQNVDWEREKIEVFTIERNMGSSSHTVENYLVPEGAQLQIIQSDNLGQVVLKKFLSIPVRPKAGVAASMR